MCTRKCTNEHSASRARTDRPSGSVNGPLPDRLPIPRRNPELQDVPMEVDGNALVLEVDRLDVPSFREPPDLAAEWMRRLDGRDDVVDAVKVGWREQQVEVV